MIYPLLKSQRKSMIAALVLILLSLCLEAAYSKEPVIRFIGPDPLQPYQTVADTTIQTIGGSGVAGAIGDGGLAVDARLNSPQDVIIHPNGHSVIVADFNNHRLRQIDLDNGLISTFAGNGINAATGNAGPAFDAAIAAPSSLAVDDLGNIYVGTLHQIRVINSSGIIDLFAGSTPGDSGDGLPASQAQFRTIGGIAVNIDGSLLVADIQNNKIKQIKDGRVFTIAGTGASGRAGDGGPPTFAQLDNPVDVAVDPFGVIYIAERLGSRIRVIRNGIISTLYDRAFDPDFFGPRRLAMYKDYFLYFSSSNNVVRRLNVFDGVVETVAGNGNTGYSGDGGPADLATLNQPVGLAIDNDGNMFIADTSNHAIRFVTIPPSEIEPTPVPTNTPTPTPTPTLTPTNTPTRTPRARTPSPTQTPFPTLTPTSTPTGFPAGQLTDNIPEGESLEPNHVFYRNSTEVYIPSATEENRVKVVVSSTRDGQGSFSVNDTLVLGVSNPSGTIHYSTITIADQGTPEPPLDITSMFAKGRNQVEGTFIDAKGDSYSSSEIYIVVYSAPVLRDLPDIRALVGQELENVYSMEDYLTDRDTPISDVTWSITVNDPRGPDIQVGARQTISVIPNTDQFKPYEGSFNVVASDGVFTASDEVFVKYSSFMYDNFILEEGPMVDDYAFVSPFNLTFNLTPPGVNVVDVPVETTFEAGKGLKDAQVAHGSVYLFPEFPGGKASEPIDVSLVAQRETNLNDYDGAVIQTSSVFPPAGGLAERNYNFSAPSFEETQWEVTVPENRTMGTATLGPIPDDPVQAITDGYGAIVEVDPGEITALISGDIELPPGPAMISMWFAVENTNGVEDDFPTITLALYEDSFNISLTTIRGKEILGKSQYQYLATTYDVLGEVTKALIQVDGTQNSGKVQVYVDSIRIYPMPRDIDRALGITTVPVLFDGSFEDVIRGLGNLFEVNQQATVGAQAFLSKAANRTVNPNSLNFQQSLLLDLIRPTSAIQLEVGPNFIDPTMYPRFLSARAYTRVEEEGGGFFALGLTNGLVDAVTYISNDRLPRAVDEWREVTATGLFTQPGEFEPLIILQNQNIPGAIPSVFDDGATVAVDDISIEAFQDSPNFWDQKRLPKLK